MKNRNRIVGNRTVIGIICVLLALGITFGVAPLVTRFADRKVDVVVMKKNVERGHIITEDDVELKSVGAQNLSSKTAMKKELVVGKYAATALFEGQMILRDHISGEGSSAESVLSLLDGTKVAVSVNVNNYANAVSDKISNGDIVSAIVYDRERDSYFIPSALKYVKVITTTSNTGVDKDVRPDGEQAATVTLLVTPEQAETLAKYNHTSFIHFALVCRGDKEIAEQFLKAQDEYLSNSNNEAEESDG